MDCSGRSTSTPASPGSFIEISGPRDVPIFSTWHRWFKTELINSQNTGCWCSCYPNGLERSRWISVLDGLGRFWGKTSTNEYDLMVGEKPWKKNCLYICRLKNANLIISVQQLNSIHLNLEMSQIHTFSRIWIPRPKTPRFFGALPGSRTAFQSCHNISTTGSWSPWEIQNPDISRSCRMVWVPVGAPTVMSA